MMNDKKRTGDVNDTSALLEELRMKASELKEESKSDSPTPSPNKPERKAVNPKGEVREMTIKDLKEKGYKANDVKVEKEKRPMNNGQSKHTPMPKPKHAASPIPKEDVNNGKEAIEKPNNVKAAEVQTSPTLPTSEKSVGGLMRKPDGTIQITTRFYNREPLENYEDLNKDFRIAYKLYGRKTVSERQIVETRYLTNMTTENVIGDLYGLKRKVANDFRQLCRTPNGEDFLEGLESMIELSLEKTKDGKLMYVVVIAESYMCPFLMGMPNSFVGK